MLHSLPLRGPDGGPVKRIQRIQFCQESRVIRACVATANGPSLSGRDTRRHRAHQMHDGLLAPCRGPVLPLLIVKSMGERGQK